MEQPSTGIEALDELLGGGLGVGDNVVWQAADPAEIESFVEGFLATARGGTPLTYLSFRLPPAAVLDRFGRVWDSERFMLLDGWTSSQEGSTGRKKGAAAAARRKHRVRRLKDPADMEQVNRELAEIEDELGSGAGYVFDDLTSLQRLWGAEAALASFLRWCPRLYQERTVAYWLLEREAHPPAFRSRLADITQVILDLEATPAEAAERTLQVVKADGHPPGVAGRALRYLAGDDGRIQVARQAAEVRERIGEQVRAERIAAGLSQTELARRIGVTPSALSQVERGRHGLSGETLTRLWATLGVPFGPGASSASPPYRLARRGARQPLTPAAGLSGETVLADPSGLAAHELTVAAGASGRRPFETKQPELVLVLEGALELQPGQETHTLQQGDAILLPGQPVTGWRNPAREPARVLWVVLDA
jgi:transcriptional regulator with XRE-family HTH domain/KaiC/GvpD/RAD55 family RecA-like ATPase